MRILCKHNVKTHFLKTEIARSVKGPELQGLHAEDKCESENNHRYAVVVQDSATQWIQAYPCKKQDFTGTPEKLAKVPGTREETKLIHTDNSLEFCKACEDLSWNHCTSTPHRSETNGIAERAVRRVKEGTSAVLLQSGLNESWWADSMECYTYLRNVTDLPSDG